MTTAHQKLLHRHVIYNKLIELIVIKFVPVYQMYTGMCPNDVSVYFGTYYKHIHQSSYMWSQLNRSRHDS